MEKCTNNKYKNCSSRNGFATRTSALRCFLKQPSISSTLSVPIRIAPAWSRMLRFGNTTKFKTDEFFQVNGNLWFDLFLLSNEWPHPMLRVAKPNQWMINWCQCATENVDQFTNSDERLICLVFYQQKKLSPEKESNSLCMNYSKNLE